MWRAASVTAALAALAVGAIVHWHVTFYQHNTYVTMVKPRPRPQTYRPMTIKGCESLRPLEPASQVEAEYGRAAGTDYSGSDWDSIGVVYPGRVDFYNIAGDRECDVYYGVHDRVRYVYEELLP